MPPVLRRLREEGYALDRTGADQRFPMHLRFSLSRAGRRLIVGNERLGIEEESLRLLDETVEIPVYGLPYAHNAATAAAMALYEYCRQYPKG